jgi:DNA-directed RNA polymerase alpha subunit
MAKRELAEIIYRCYEAGYTQEELLTYAERFQHQNKEAENRSKQIARDFLLYRPRTFREYGEQHQVSVASISQNAAFIGARFLYLVRNGRKYSTTASGPDSIFYYINENDNKLESRILNALSRAGLLDLEDLYHTSDEQLYRIRNLGPKALEKIKQIQQSYGDYKGYRKE